MAPMVGGGSSFAGSNNIMVFIDGSYLTKNINEKFDNAKINFSNLVRFLANQSSSDTRLISHLVRTYYYDATPHSEDVDLWNDDVLCGIGWDKVEDKKREQEPIFQMIRNEEMIDLRLGRLVLSPVGGLKNKGNWIFRQKGVDTLIAIDMLTKAFDRQYDIAILLAGDADFLELVNSKESGT